MGQLRQRVRLIHELRKLRAAEEIANHRAQRFRVDQLLRRHAVDVDVEQRHALFHETLRAGETDAALIGEQFANGADAAAAEMIDVIERAFAAAQIDQILDRGDEIFVGQNALAEIDIDAELLIESCSDRRDRDRISSDRRRAASATRARSPLSADRQGAAGDKYP